jgi:hypothetical protein
MDVIDAADALDLVGGGLAPEELGPFSGVPALFVRTTDPGTAARCAALLRRLPCVAVAVDDTGAIPSDLDDFDVLLTARGDPPRPWTEGSRGIDALICQLRNTIEVSPLASVALVQLLRLGERLDVRDALVAESLTYGLLQSGDEFRYWLERQPGRLHRESDEPPVRVERAGTEVVLELHRPEVRNAYDVSMRDTLVDALTAVHADPSVESIRLEGAGPTFCSGGDLSEFGATPDPVTGHFVRATRNAGWWLAELGSKMTTHVRGACVGAGVELPAFGERVIADPATTFMLPEISMGLVPGAGGTASIPRRIGRHRTASLALPGTAIGAVTALEWGLIDEIRGGS